MINQISLSPGLQYQPESARKTTSKTEEKKSGDYDSAFSLDISLTSEAKGNRGLTSKEIEKLQNQADAATSALKDMVEKLIVGQKSNNASLTLNIEILTAAETAGPAEIAEDADWGVEAVSDRIVDFAKSLSGGDASKIETLRTAIDKGFASAKKALGGKLPAVSMDTYDAVMLKLDNWAAESQPVPTETAE